MRLDDQRQSDNVEDRRGQSGRHLPGARSLGLGAILIALAASYFLGVDPGAVLNLLEGGGAATQAVDPGPAPRIPANDEKAIFVSRVLASTEDTWAGIFAQAGRSYTPPKLVLFTDAYPTACGLGQAAAGPFYCPADGKVYIDLRFYQLMRDRFHAAGDFAQAYVVAHEVGHHIQKLLGITDQMQALRGRVPQAEYNALSVRLELQADCLAGVWARRADQNDHLLEPGDIEQAQRAAAAIGDDTLQKQAQGYAVPDSFTHGSAEQRVRWLQRGLDSGDLRRCDTFKAQTL